MGRRPSLDEQVRAYYEGRRAATLPNLGTYPPLGKDERFRLFEYDRNEEGTPRGTVAVLTPFAEQDEEVSFPLSKIPKSASYFGALFGFYRSRWYRVVPF
jgi:hypothetical protein